MISAILGLLAPFVKPLIEWVHEKGLPMVRDLFIYRKGAADQRRKDIIKSVESQLDTIRRAQAAAQEVERDAQVDKFSDHPRSHIRVRKPGGWESK